MKQLIKNIALIGFLASALVGCATVPPTSSASNVVRFDPETQQAVQKNFETLGWIYLGSTTRSVKNGEALHFVNPNSVTRFGQVARVHSFIANAVKSPKTGLSSMALQVQYDCQARTSQILTIDAFADHLAKVPLISVREADKAEPVNVNTVNDAIMVAACTGRLEALGKGAVKASGEKGKI
jgi:hypothetical protein